ncbi:MFS transporter, partial [Acinetobacter baumannii]
GTALLISRGLDTLSDPLIGLLSDRTRSRFGRRKPWILAGALVSALGFARIAFPPQGVDAGYLTVWLVVLYLGWTAVV